MLCESLYPAGVGLVLVASLALIIKLTLAMIVVVRAHRQDLPDIVRGLAGWFYHQRR